MPLGALFELEILQVLARVDDLVNFMVNFISSWINNTKFTSIHQNAKYPIIVMTFIVFVI